MSIENVEVRLTEQEKRMAETKKNLEERFGPHLGKAFFNYVHWSPKNADKAREHRTEFVRLVPLGLSNTSIYDRNVEVIAALLEAVEAKIEPEAWKATKARVQTAPIGLRDPGPVRLGL